MRAELVRWFEHARVPRYTSYPTAPHFGPGIDAARYEAWLRALDPQLTLSLYLHIPYCRQLCWYCGCHTYITHRDDRVAAYLDLLLAEIDRVAALLPGRFRVVHLHWGGGTPSIVGPSGLRRTMERLRTRFAFMPDAELAIELDPRMVDAELAEALAEVGINRVSLGVQTLDPRVQEAINRPQPYRQVAECFRLLRRVGIRHFSVDLLYGLPAQTRASARESVERLLDLEPDRAAVFGYAHLPRLKRHQRLIDATSLPDAEERAAQFEAMAATFEDAGYVAIGLDHFARPGDSMACALAEGRLHRNFQGYTTDPADVLLGFGASAIGSLPRGYVQNAADLRAYRAAVAGGGLPIQRGLELSREDRAIRAVIERIMCYGEVDLAAIARQFALPVAMLAPDPERMAQLESLGVARRSGQRVVLEPGHRPLLRLLAAAFDRYLEPDSRRHAVAI